MQRGRWEEGEGGGDACRLPRLWSHGAHLDQGLPTKGGPKELPEGHLEVAAANAAQVKERVRPCCQQKDPPEPIPASHAELLELWRFVSSLNLRHQWMVFSAKRGSLITLHLFAQSFSMRHQSDPSKVAVLEMTAFERCEHETPPPLQPSSPPCSGRRSCWQHYEALTSR